jgi:hypothetical protein
MWAKGVSFFAGVFRTQIRFPGINALIGTGTPRFEEFSMQVEHL